MEHYNQLHRLESKGHHECYIYQSQQAGQFFDWWESTQWFHEAVTIGTGLPPLSAQPESSQNRKRAKQIFTGGRERSNIYQFFRPGAICEQVMHANGKILHLVGKPIMICQQCDQDLAHPSIYGAKGPIGSTSLKRHWEKCKRRDQQSVLSPLDNPDMLNIPVCLFIC
jgi:hypothetical protein